MHHCQLEPGQYGACRARKNENGTVICANYGQVTSLALDPIEKKPLNIFPADQRLIISKCNPDIPFRLVFGRFLDQKFR